uniref:Uncharacterized protein n=1 Tax=Rhizophora mucronata TaxID=61149 RepID=A0A2P2R555_RHIMU
MSKQLNIALSFNAPTRNATGKQSSFFEPIKEASVNSIHYLIMERS